MKILIFLSGIFAVGLLVACKQNEQASVDFRALSMNPTTIIVDVRTPVEFTAGHMQQSVNIPLSVIPYSIDNLKSFENIIVVCRSGNRSGQAKKILEENGLNNVYNGGGWADFQRHYLDK